MQEEQKKSSRKKPQSFLGELFEWVKILLVAGIAAFLLNNYVIANSTIPTGSMENTFLGGKPCLRFQTSLPFRNSGKRRCGYFPVWLSMPKRSSDLQGK